MTTLTINIPDSSLDIISEISAIVKTAGGNIAINSDDDLSDEELELLKSSYREALSIKDGKAKGIPVSALWNE